ncbi:uncharacterized protein LOC109714763 [Ananas comosus]|uniref:Uncharacterized protein LOC109710696 n=1 Tax=Ananas comosus TaxID=4615 RepID=A0A6P5FGI4_ANACO|nr:uncharacterized protein LOC109710696 [Ananas comosus]XP_020095064.1 uncharacterized protein LOC109714763 [Ananas comosus]
MVQDQIALTILILSVSQEVGCNLVGLTSSHQVWATLATLFDSHTIAQEDFIEQQWRDIKKGDTPMIEYLKNVKQLATQFSLIGKPIMPLQLNRRITTGLGNDWEPLIRALAPSLSTMSTNDMSALLLNQEARCKYATSIEMTPPLSGLLGPTPATANFVEGKGRSNSSRGASGHGGHYRGQNKGRGNPNYGSSPLNSTGFFNPNGDGFPNQMSLFNQHRPIYKGGPTQGFHAEPSHAQTNTAHGTRSNDHDLDWYIDSGATHHVTADLANLNIQADHPSTDQLHIGDGSDNSCFFELHPHHFSIKDLRTRQELLRGTLKDGLYCLQPRDRRLSIAHAFLTMSQSSILWHQQLGHPAFPIIQRISKCSFYKNHVPYVCASCQLGKIFQLSFPLTHNKTYVPLALIHTDV